MLAGGIGQGYGEQKQQQQQDAFLKALLGQIQPVPPVAAQPGIPVAPGGVNLRGQMQGAGRPRGLY